MITFNGVALPDWVSVTGVSFETSNLSILEHEAGRRVGTVDAGVKRGGITITLDLFIEPSRNMTLLDQSDVLKRFIRGDNWKVSELILLEQPDKFYNARVSDSGELTDYFTHGENSISFYCADPKKYSTNESMAMGMEGQADIDYNGLEDTPTVIEMIIPSDTSEISVKHVESNRKISLTGEFKTGQELTIDSKNRNILLNGNSVKNLMKFESNWINLTGETNTLIVSDANDAIKDFTVTYRTAD